MGGDAQLSNMKATYYPPSIQPGFMGAHPPVKVGYGSLSDSGHISYFQNYRNENLSKMQMPPYEWGMMNTPYSPRPDIAIKGKGTNWNRMLQMPRSPVTFLDPGRQQEVDDFYKVHETYVVQLINMSLSQIEYLKEVQESYRDHMQLRNKAAQMHRDQYKDHAGRLHPLRYFKTNEYQFQCPPDLSRTYMKFPEATVKYKDPPVLPITLERSYRSPYLPERALTGRYAPSSDISYKR